MPHDELTGGLLRLPIAPPEQVAPEDEPFFPETPAVLSAGTLQRLERLLDDGFQRLEGRLDMLSERLPGKRKAPRASKQHQPADQPALGHDAAKEPLISRGSPGGSPRASPPGMAPKMSIWGPDARPPTSPRPQPPRRDVEPEVGPDGCPLTPPKLSERSSFEEEKSAEQPSSMKTTITQWLKGKSTGESHQGVASDKTIKRATTEERIARHWDDLAATTSAARAGSIIHGIVMHKWFDCAITAMVLLSAVMVGVQVDYEVRNPGEQLVAVDYFEYVATGVFTIELVLRILAVGCATLCGKGERGLFCVDVVLVLVSWVDIVFSLLHSVADVDTSSSASKAIKLVRIGRIMRIIRTIRVLAELRVMANMIWNSLRSLMWLFSILVALAYCFALILTQGASMYLQQPEPLSETERAQLENAFGSILLTMYSLFKSMTGGRNWGEIADMIEPAGIFYSGCVSLYIFLNLFSVLNVVTGVFVDGAIELGKRDRSMMIRKQGQKREASAQHLVQLLRDMDTEGNGYITRDEFLDSMYRYEVREFMQALSIDLKDADNMFTLLDRNMDGMVDIVEFVQGMEKLRGEAKSSDIHFLMLQCQHIADMLMSFQGIPLPEPLDEMMAAKTTERSGDKTFGPNAVISPGKRSSGTSRSKEPMWDLAFYDLGAVVQQKRRRSSTVTTERGRRSSGRSDPGLGS